MRRGLFQLVGIFFLDGMVGVKMGFHLPKPLTMNWRCKPLARSFADSKKLPYSNVLENRFDGHRSIDSGILNEVEGRLRSGRTPCPNLAFWPLLRSPRVLFKDLLMPCYSGFKNMFTPIKPSQPLVRRHRRRRCRYRRIRSFLRCA